MTDLLLPTPAGACDCHMHVFGDQVRYPLQSLRSYTPPVAGLESYLVTAGTIGLSRCVLVQASAYGARNETIVDAMASRPDTTRGVAGLDAATSREQIAALDAAGVRGIRINCVSRGETNIRTIEREIRAADEKIADFGWHIQLYVRAEVLERLEPVLTGMATEFVLDHMALPRSCDPDRPDMHAVFRLLDRNCWIKVAGVDRLNLHIGATEDDVEGLIRAFLRHRPDRVVWGSDWPHVGLHQGKPVADAPVVPHRQVDAAALLNLIARAAEDETIYAQILSENPARLYDFGPA